MTKRLGNNGGNKLMFFEGLIKRAYRTKAVPVIKPTWSQDVMREIRQLAELPNGVASLFNLERFLWRFALPAMVVAIVVGSYSLLVGITPSSIIANLFFEDPATYLVYNYYPQ